MNSIKENDLRLINIYGFAEGLVLDQISGDDCVVKVIQINGDNLYVDTCYATMDEMMTNFEKNGNNFSLKFKENRPQNIKLL